MTIRGTWAFVTILLLLCFNLVVAALLILVVLFLPSSSASKKNHAWSPPHHCRDFIYVSSINVENIRHICHCCWENQSFFFPLCWITADLMVALLQWPQRVMINSICKSCFSSSGTEFKKIRLNFVSGKFLRNIWATLSEIKACKKIYENFFTCQLESNHPLWQTWLAFVSNKLADAS